ncbi:uncharacterized protein LOC144562670 [Carex rostrata]
MVYYGLEITANLIGLDSLQPRGGVDDPNHPYFIKLQCENCGEIGPRFSCVMLSREIPPPNRKGKVNMIQKCQLCDRVGTVKMISGHGKPLTRALGESSRYAQIMVFECHGLAPVEFSFGDRWKAQSSKALWEIDLSEGEFHSDDERVHLTGLKAKFEVVKCLCRCH